MNHLAQKLHRHNLRRLRVRARVTGTTERPRLSIFVSNRNIIAQIVDDSLHKTLVYISTANQKQAGGTMTDKAIWTGKEIAKKAKAKKLNKVVFDRNGRIYHGRIKALADAARAEGLEF